MPTLYLSRPRVLEWAALAVILALAIVLRLGSPGIVEFKTDEANLSVMSLDMVRGRSFPLLGIDSSVGIPNAPVSIYLMAIPYFFSSSPETATSFVALLGVISVGLMYILVRRYYGPLAAVTAAALYAVGPWAVIFTRKIWAQDLLPVFVLLTIGAALLGFIEGKRWAQLICLPLLTITGQIHYGTFVLIPAVVYLIVVGRKRLTRYFAFSFVLTLLVVLPYVIGLAQAGLLGAEGLRKFASNPTKPSSLEISANTFAFASDAVAGTGLTSLTGEKAWPEFSATLPFSTNFFPVLSSTAVGSALWLAYRAVRRRHPRSRIDIAILLWFLATPIAFAVTWTQVYIHYMIPFLMAGFVVIGIGVSEMWKGLATVGQTERRVLSAVGAALIIGIIVLQIWTQIALVGFVAKNVTPGGFATPLGYLMTIREAVLGYRPKQVLAKLDGQYIGYHNDASVWYALLYDVPLVRMLDEQTEVYPTEPALYLSQDCSETTRNFGLRPGEPCYAITTRNADDLDLGKYGKTNEAGLRFANGAKIIAYRWEADPACLSVVWTVNGPAPKEDFQFAVHFINSDKADTITADNLSWRGRYWREGDTVVNRYCLKREEDKAHKTEIAGVRLGMYVFEDTAEGRKFYGQDLYDVNGATAGQQLEIAFR
jgi:4-amino-4-deoxy-L-arabinose transferase-like glycosyltransferase